MTTDDVCEDALPLTGRCACGAIHYDWLSPPFDAGYCHCRICQLTSGAPVMAFATVLLADYHVTSGEPLIRQSSEFGERGFCGACGTPLTMRDTHQPDTIDFTIATLEWPEAVAPGFHIWMQRRIAWFETSDSLPRHARFRADTVGLSDEVDRGACA
ncbi:GFA family protein [Rhizorhabdus histidinilytica]|uniref:GFA family protein n=1 Tax=Rhizorhabdus histidinilytica TaxID=439228 RepID=UPI001ADC5451|nr:GFA family protein [Rhizorhabdus histidinilytica]